MDSRTDFRSIIQDNLIRFVSAVPSHRLRPSNRAPQMGRRFPEFCVLTAACRVSVRASPFATGDARVASYQAAINSIAERHYTHWPFMVEVLNKWLEANQDFVRDPSGYVAPNPSPAPTSTQDTASQTTATFAAVTSGHAHTHGSPMAADVASSPCDAEAPECTTGSAPAASTTGMDLVDLPSPLLSWIGFLPSLGSLGVGNLTSRIPFSSSRGWFATPKSPTQQISSSPKAGWFRPFFLADSYWEWWDILRKSLALGSG